MSRFTILMVFVCLNVLCSGCAEKPSSHRITQSDAEKRFLKICREENKLPVQLFNADNAIWIYLPMDEDLIYYHGTQKKDAAPKKQSIISTFEGTHIETQYRFLMDITDGIKTSADLGLKSDATEAFTKNRLIIYGALEAFLEINELPGDRQFADKVRDKKRQDMLENHIPKTKAPEFIAIVIANTTKGIAYKTILNINDYKLYRSEALPFDEYNLREFSELYGDRNLINDKDGKNLEIKPINWSWFLIEQIKKRVEFKFLRSDFPPKKDMIIEIASIIADTFRYYEYADYTGVLIKDLRDNTSYNFDRPQLITFEETAGKTTPPPLRMHYITGPDQTAH